MTQEAMIDEAVCCVLDRRDCSIIADMVDYWGCDHHAVRYLCHDAMRAVVHEFHRLARLSNV